MLDLASVNPLDKIPLEFIHILVLTSHPPLRKLGSIETQTTHRGVKMETLYYTVKAELKTFPFSPSKVVYVLREHSTVWAGDCSSNYGTGSHEASTKVIDKSEDRVFI